MATARLRFYDKSIEDVSSDRCMPVLRDGNGEDLMRVKLVVEFSWISRCLQSPIIFLS